MNKFLIEHGYYINVNYITDRKVTIDIGKAFSKNRKPRSCMIECSNDGFTRLFIQSKNGLKQKFIVENCGENLVDRCINALLLNIKNETNINANSYLTINK